MELVLLPDIFSFHLIGRFPVIERTWTNGIGAFAIYFFISFDWKVHGYRAYMDQWNWCFFLYILSFDLINSPSDIRRVVDNHMSLEETIKYGGNSVGIDEYAYVISAS